MWFIYRGKPVLSVVSFLMHVFVEFGTLYFVKGAFAACSSLITLRHKLCQVLGQETRQKPYPVQFCVISMKLSLFSRPIKRIYLFLAKDNTDLSVQMEREMECQLSELSPDHSDSESRIAPQNLHAGHMRIWCLGQMFHANSLYLMLTR